MSLLNLIRSSVIGRDTAATPATPATFRNTRYPTVARVATVARVTERIESALPARATVAMVRGAAERQRVNELRHLLKDLLWDAPYKVELEIGRALRNGALEEALRCYRQCWREYHELEELHDQRHWPGCLEGRSYNP